MKRLLLISALLLFASNGWADTKTLQESQPEQAESDKMTYLECKNPRLIKFESTGNSLDSVSPFERVFIKLRFIAPDISKDLIDIQIFHSSLQQGLSWDLGELDLENSEVKWEKVTTNADSKKIEMQHRVSNSFGQMSIKHDKNYLLNRETLHLGFDFEYLLNSDKRPCWKCSYGEITYQCEITSSDNVDQIFQEMITKKKLGTKMEAEKRRKADEEQREKNKL